MPDEVKMPDDSERAEVARRAAAKSIVLPKNDGMPLPLPAGATRIPRGAILEAAGGLAADAGDMASRAIAPWNGTVSSVSTNDGIACVDYALRPTDRSFIQCQLLLPAKEK